MTNEGCTCRKGLINYLTVLPKFLALVWETKLEEFDITSCGSRRSEVWFKPQNSQWQKRHFFRTTCIINLLMLLMYSVAYLVLSLVCVRRLPSPHRSIHFRLGHVTRTHWSRGSNEALGLGNSVANITTVKSNRSVIKVKDVTNDNLYPSLNKFVLFSGGWKAFWKPMQNRGGGGGFPQFRVVGEKSKL